MLRLLVSLGLLLDWLLFLTGASALGWTLLILAAVPIATFILGQSVCDGDARPLVRSRMASQSAHRGDRRRAMQAIVVLIAAAVAGACMAAST